MTGPILPPIPMLSGGGNGKVYLVVGLITAFVLLAKKKSDPLKAATAAAVK